MTLKVDYLNYFHGFLQAAEMVEDEVDPDSQSWGGMRGKTVYLKLSIFIPFK